jgi:glycosyltransferase involved in cell wall biosynthesis
MSVTSYGEAEPTVSVVAPAFNEQESIEDFVVEVCRNLDACQQPYELICVDDGSTDQTARLLGELQARFPRLRLAAFEHNQGQSAALAAGVALARGRYIALTDSDLQNDPADLVRLLGMLLLDGSVDCLVGVRALRRDSWLRRVSSRIANAVGRWITRAPVRDGACGLKVCRADLLQRVAFFRGAHRFLATLVTLEGGRVQEIEVNHRPRLKGESKYGNGLGRTFVALRDAFGVRWMMDRRIHYTLKTPGRNA